MTLLAMYSCSLLNIGNHFPSPGSGVLGIFVVTLQADFGFISHQVLDKKYMIIESIASPADVKRLSVEEMEKMAVEIRTLLIEKLSRHGGHCGPYLGMVEATIAMHYVFQSPQDKIVFDVSHQSYTHKMLTGRVGAFLKAENDDDVSGYSEPSESEHDHFIIGHTSTAVSLAGGLAKGRDLRGEQGNVIAVVGEAPPFTLHHHRFAYRPHRA